MLLIVVAVVVGGGGGGGGVVVVVVLLLLLLLVVAFSLPVFIVVSLISRSLRFFIVAYLSYKFGDLFTEFMEKHGSKWFTIIGILIVIVLGIIFLIFKFNA